MNATIAKPIARDHTVEVGSLRLHYLEWGDRWGAPVVLLHGITTHAHIWDTFAAVTARRSRVLALDQRGHGESSWAGTYTTADFVADLHAVVEALRLPPFVLIGLSMGAHNGMAYAARYPQRVSRLVLVDLAPDFVMTPDLIQSRSAEATTAFAALPEALALARAGNPIAPHHELYLRTVHNLRRDAQGLLRFRYDPAVITAWSPANLWPELPRIAAPALILRGAVSPLFTARAGEMMAAAIPSARFLEVPGAGHTVPNDQPARFRETVSAFLTG